MGHMRQVVKSENTIIKFGKYKGHTFKEILALNYEYLIWLHEDGIVLFKDNTILNQAIEKDMQHSPPEDFFWQG